MAARQHADAAADGDSGPSYAVRMPTGLAHDAVVARINLEITDNTREIAEKYDP